MSQPMNRLEQIRTVVDGCLLTTANQDDLRCGFVHLYGVSATAALLARLRGLDEELAAIAAMLHDLASYESGDADEHAGRSAARAVEILKGLGGFTEREIACIESAIAHHSDKEMLHGSYEELLKDADVLQHDLYNSSFPPDPHHKDRRERLRQSLSPGAGADATP